MQCYRTTFEHVNSGPSVDEDLTTKETKDGSEDKYPRKAVAIVSSYNAASGPHDREESTLGRAHLIE